MDIKPWLILILIVENGGLSQNVNPVFEIDIPDAFENDERAMKCVLKESPCNPNSIFIQRFEQGWLDACIVHRNRTYQCFIGTIGDRVTARYSSPIKEFKLEIDPLSIEDNGNWRCRVDNCPSTQFSNEISLLISTHITDSDIIIKAPDDILLNATTQYTCTSLRVYPEVNVTWSQGGDITTGESNNILEGETYRIENTNTFTFCERNKMDVSCTLAKTSGTNHWNFSRAADVIPVYAPAVVEDSDTSYNNPTIVDDLVIFCLASGTSRNIEWKKDGVNLPDGLFTVKNVTVQGIFTCEESEATNSTITWIQHDSPTCDDVTKHNGSYQCIVTAVKGTTDTSTEHEIVVHHPPILVYTTQEEEAIIGSTITLYCEIDCAKPNTLTYTWTSDNEREGIGSFNAFLNITVGAADFNTTFICTVNNTVGSSSMTFTITEIFTPIPPTPDPTTTDVVTTTEGVNVTTPAPDNTALIIANAVIWSLCGIVAIVLVCLALYHYRQIQNGKKYQRDYSEDIVLTDNEEKPATALGFGSDECDDISHSVVSKESVGGAVGGMADEGLYAEVQTPTLTNMPVAPKRASKIKASQPQQSTPQTKRTHATNASKSPMIDRRHQPNSPSNGRRLESAADYSLASKRKEIPPQQSNESNLVSKGEQHQQRQESPNKAATGKPSVPTKPNIQSFRLSRSSGIDSTGTPFDNVQGNMYINCDQQPVPKNDDGTITYADLALQQEDPYDEGAPPVPPKKNDKEPVQYASIKHSK